MQSLRKPIAWRFWIGLLLASLAACESPTPALDPVDEAISLRQQHDYDGAMDALRKAMRLRPDDAEVRLLVAEVYVDLGKGDLAESAIRQALDRGLPKSRVVVTKARALFAQGHFRDVLELEADADLSASEGIRLQHLQAEALAARSTSTDRPDDDVTQAFIDLFEQMAQYSGDVIILEISTLLMNSRTDRPEIERAWQHYACALNTQDRIEWQPVDRHTGNVFRVGPARAFKTVAEAARAARDGDTVEIDAGTYRGHVARWPQNNIIVRGVGGRPSITADGKAIEERDVWLFSGNDVVIENVEISGARSKYENGAAIRHMGEGLTLRHVYLHDNENGVLTSNRYPGSNTILIEFSEFARNGDHRGYAHNIYIGRSRRFEMRYSYSHASHGGHLVKSRAQQNVLAYNRLTDTEEGTSSYVIDIPEGGVAQIIGNEIEQGSATLNHGIISFAGEKIAPGENVLHVTNNSFYNRDFRGIGVRNHNDLAVRLANNLFGGAAVGMVEGQADLVANLTQADHGMVDPRKYNYQLDVGAAAVDAGATVDSPPLYEYVHPTAGHSRRSVWRLDIGAHERCGL